MNRFRSHTVRVVAEALLRLPRKVGYKDRLILAYHNIVPDTFMNRGDSSLHLRISDFEQQLKYLCEHTTVVSLPQILSDNLPNGPYASITFDDAYFGAVSDGLSICRSFGIQPTVFVAPGLLGKVPAWDARSELHQWSPSARRRFLTAERGLDAGSTPDAFENPHELRIANLEEIRSSVAISGAFVGNHTFRHPNLRQLTPRERLDELVSASSYLSAAFRDAFIPIVAFPYGSVPRDASLLLQASGLTTGLGVVGGWIPRKTSSRNSILPRWNVSSSVPFERFKLSINGYFCK